MGITATHTVCQFPAILLAFLGTCFVSVLAAAPIEDAAQKAPPVNIAPGPEYADSVRAFQGIPGIERAANGRLWATWYGGGNGEDRHSYVMLATSGDDGRNWSPVKLVIDPDGDGPCRAFDPCLWHDPRGRLWLFWSQRDQSVQTWAMVAEDSASENPKWSAPRLIQPGIMLNKPLVLPAGAWLLPVATWKREGSAKVAVSTDEGVTFSLRGSANIPETADRNCDEHIIVARKDGSLWMLVRARYGIGQSVSSDGGRTWSEVQPAAMRHTASRFFIRRLNSGKLLLVKHGNIDEKTGRCCLRAFLSDDDGKTWGGGLLIDEREKVSYPDGVQAPDGTIHLIYDLGRNREKQILMATFTEEDVARGEWSSQKARQRVVVNQASGTPTK